MLYVLLARLLGVDWYLKPPGDRQPTIPIADQQKLLADLVKIALGLAAGIGAAFALVVGYRRARVEEASSHRDDRRLFSSRYQDAADLIGNEKPAVRLAGIYAMARLADDWEEQQQQCIDVLCAYLRLPYEPVESDPGEREVRLTIIRLITAHLLPSATQSWQGRDLHFTGAVFDGGDFRHAVFSGGEVNFSEAQFSGGKVDFTGAQFSGSTVDFINTQFSGGNVSFRGAKFSGGNVSFRGAKFSGGMVEFAQAQLCGGEVDFSHAQLSGGDVVFTATLFSGADVRFRLTRFLGSDVHFNLAQFSGGTVDFSGAEFSSGTVDLNDALFFGSTVKVSEAHFSGGTVDFNHAQFSGGIVVFIRPSFFSGTLDFGQAQFSGGIVHFDFSEDSFVEGTVNLSETLLDANGVKPSGLPTGAIAGLQLPNWL
ncbi:hypothetical protein BWI15_00300 [Kribbella sp. ALI-6-A]|nr:hypothetical protein BWI15_00300 [Kribbella sp. ALI-6-A]